VLLEGADAFWLAFVVLLAYECLDKHGTFVLRLVWHAGGWSVLLPSPALRMRDGHLEFHGPLDWLRVEVCVNWLRVEQEQPAEAMVSEAKPTAAEIVAVPAPFDAAALHSLRIPVAVLASSLLLVLPLTALVFGVSNWLLAAISLIYASAAWLGWCLVRLGAACPEVRPALRSLGLEIFFCPLFGIGAVRKATKLLLPQSMVHYRDGLSPSEWPQLVAWVDGQLKPLEAYWQDKPSGGAADDTRMQWRARFVAARAFYTETVHAAQ